MKKNRLEAFSDGVFAIVITLLVLDIDLPDVPYSGLQNALIAFFLIIRSVVFMGIGKCRINPVSKNS